MNNSIVSQVLCALILSISLLTGCGGGDAIDGGNTIGTDLSGISGSGTVATTGGTVVTDLADITVPPDATLQAVKIKVSSINQPAGLPAGLTAIGKAVDVEVSNPHLINEPFTIKIKYNDTGIADENNLTVLHYNISSGRYEPVTVLAHDQSENTITINSRSFSPFVVVTFPSSLIPSSYTVTGFTPEKNGWNIPNFGSYFSPGGNCLGMSAYAVWYADNKTDNLNGKYSADSDSPNFMKSSNPKIPVDTTSIAALVIQRAMLAQTRLWSSLSSLSQITLLDDQIANLMKLYLAIFDKPLVLVLKVNDIAKHASVVYGYDTNSFTFYDVNVMNTAQTVTFDGTNWGTYGEYNSFSFLALPSLGRTEDFAQLTKEAEKGFTSSGLIFLTSPTNGEVISDYDTTLIGSLSDSLNYDSVLVYAREYLQLISVNDGNFGTNIPISAGDNTITILAGADIDNQSNWYANAATLITNVQGTQKGIKLKVTMSYETDYDYTLPEQIVNLYVIEPPNPLSEYNPDYDHASTQGTDSINGLTSLARTSSEEAFTVGVILDTTVLPESGELLTPTGYPTVVPGEYVIRAHYSLDRSGDREPVKVTVSIVVNEGTPQQLMRSKSFTIHEANFSNNDRYATGDDWFDIGTADLVNGTITFY